MHLILSVCVRLTTSALSAVAGPATVPVVGVEHGDVATLVLQIHVLLQLLQRFVHTHVGVGELCTGRRERVRTHSAGMKLQVQSPERPKHTAHNHEQDSIDGRSEICCSV